MSKSTLDRKRGRKIVSTPRPVLHQGKLCRAATDKGLACKTVTDKELQGFPFFFPCPVPFTAICTYAVVSRCLWDVLTVAEHGQPEPHPYQETETWFSQNFSIFPLHLKCLSVAWILVILLLLLDWTNLVREQSGSMMPPKLSSIFRHIFFLLPKTSELLRREVFPWLKLKIESRARPWPRSQCTETNSDRGNGSLLKWIKKNKTKMRFGPVSPVSEKLISILIENWTQWKIGCKA